MDGTLYNWDRLWGFAINGWAEKLYNSLGSLVGVFWRDV